MTVCDEVTEENPPPSPEIWEDSIEGGSERRIAEEAGEETIGV